ncbi:MAG: leucine-rich repeat domain-containing protein [Anaerolineales bacterium]
MIQTPPSLGFHDYSYSNNGLEIEPDSEEDTIYISGTDISQFPEELLKYTGATKLMIANTNISNLPEGICALTNLREISTWGNQFKTLPNWIGCLKNLNTLGMIENTLESLPPEIGNLSNLEILSIDGSCATSPCQDGPMYNRFFHLPREIGHLAKLKSIQINNTNLEDLPDEFYQLTNLQYMGLMYNNLLSISPKIENLSNLQRLDLSNNPNLTSLPPEVGKMRSLQELLLYDTGMQEIPASIKISPIPLLPIGGIHVYGFGKYYYSTLVPAKDLTGLSGKEIATRLLDNWLREKYHFVYHIDGLGCFNSDCSYFSAGWSAFLIFHGGGCYGYEKWSEYYGLLGPSSCSG